ncbi:MAG: hypothetical protein O6938_06070 [Gammaproteobacteria bacterium]|nr:hypothetical protein [Gammaproteobacteria bacterium]
MLIHWGSFQLTHEPVFEPPQLLLQELRQRSNPVQEIEPVKIGDALIFD